MTLFSVVLSPLQRDGLLALGTLIVAALVGLGVQRIVYVVLARIAARHADGTLAAVVHRSRGPSRIAFPLAAIEAATPAVSLPPTLKLPIEQILGACIIAAFAWAAIALIELAADIAKRRYRVDETDNLRARQVETRLDILGRTVSTIVVLVALSATLMTFPPIRAVGATLLAPAGLAGITAGLAARPILENLIAGMQIAFTQPIRIDDVVIVESEYGRIQRITATYVVVALWDLRKMVVPLTYFIEHPFQNWTYDHADLIRSVFLHFDYTLPVDEIRRELARILENHRLFDGKVMNVAMTEAKEQTVEIRVLVSARNSPELFDLRCDVREKLIAFIGREHPSTLPGTRVMLDAPVRETALA